MSRSKNQLDVSAAEQPMTHCWFSSFHFAPKNLGTRMKLNFSFLVCPEAFPVETPVLCQVR